VDAPDFAAAPSALALGWLFVLLRTTGLFLAAPVLGARTVPARLRLALAVAVSFGVWAAAGSPSVRAGATLATLVLPALAETARGLACGLAARAVLDALEAAGQTAGLSMGVGYGAMVDPFHGASSGVVGELLSAAGMLAAVELGLHREALAWLARSVAEAPPGTPLAARELARGLVTDLTGAAVLAMRLSFPLAAAATVGHLALGVAGRGSTPLGAGSVGFAVALLAGGASLYLCAPAFVAVAARAAGAVFAR